MHKKLDTREFIRRAREVHGDKFDYSKANYTTAHARVELTCPAHGAFTQKAYSHLSGKFMKVGITNKPKQRFSELRSKTPFMFTVIASYLMDGVQAPQIEKKAHKLMQSAGLKGFSGSTEWFRHDYDQEYAAHRLATAAGVEV